MATSPHPLTPWQEQSITALLVQESLQAAAEASGLNEKTRRRWLREDTSFQTATGKPAGPWCSTPSPRYNVPLGKPLRPCAPLGRTQTPRRVLVSLRRRRCSRRPSQASPLRPWQPAWLPAKRKGYPDEPAAAVGPRPGAGRADGRGECALSGMDGALARRARRFACSAQRGRASLSVVAPTRGQGRSVPPVPSLWRRMTGPYGTTPQKGAHGGGRTCPLCYHHGCTIRGRAYACCPGRWRRDPDGSARLLVWETA